MIVYSGESLAKVVKWTRRGLTGRADFVPLVASDRFAMLIDLYGGEWLVNVDIPALSWYRF